MPTPPPVDWDGTKERAEVRRQLYELYQEKAFSHSWWHDVAMDRAEAASQLWDPLSSTAENLFTLLLPEVLGDLTILTDVYTITAGFILLYEAILYDAVSNTLYAASLEHSIEADLSNLIAKVDFVIAACEAHKIDELTTSLEQEKLATENLYEGTVDYEIGIWNWLIDPTIPPVPFPWSEDDIYSLLVRYPKYYSVDCQFSLNIQDGLLVGLRTSLEANYLETTLLLGVQKNLPEETEAPLTLRYVTPLVADAYWTVHDEEVTEVKVREEVVANVVLTTYASMKVSGEVTVEVWKDLQFPWFRDEKHNDYETTVSINLDVGEQSSVIQLPFIAVHASHPIPGFRFQGYYLKVRFTGSGISNVGSNRIEDVWVTWIDGGGNSMKNEYPPRLRVRGRKFATKAESPVNLLIVDPEGNRVGFDYISQEVVNEITGALYNGPAMQPQVVSISEPLYGNYVVLLIGTATGPYSLTTELILPEGIVSQTFTGETVEGAVYVYNVNIAEEVITSNPDAMAELEHLKEFIDGLPDEAFDKPKLASQRKNALFSKIDEVILKVEADNYTDAINKLFHDIRAKMDADSTAQDWIIDPETQIKLCVIIDHIISNIKTLQEETG
jgi:hypothetical protein